MLRYTFVVLLAAAAYAASIAKPDCFPGTVLGIDGDKGAGEYGDKFEGDMVLEPEQIAYLKSNGRGISRNGFYNPIFRWPDNTVVYSIQEDDFNDDQISKIYAAMEDIANKSCIRFRKSLIGEYAVIIEDEIEGDVCYSKVGYLGFKLGNQTLNLGPGCFEHGSIVHEMLHTLGFFHMQSASNRDDYVRIQWENIQYSDRINFEKYNNSIVTDFGVEYDYESVMHYSAKAMSCNGKPTIVALKENVQMGQRKGMTKSDILKLNRMYCE